MPEPDYVSPLDAVPGLIHVGRLLADAVVVTDLHRRVVVWNEASERLYGIAAGDALGTPIELLYDSTIVGAATSSAGARTIAIDSGAWGGRVVDRPRIGRLAGYERFVETVLSRLDDANGEPIGVLSIKRDVTASVRVERELATLGELASSGGETRSRVAAAERALDVLRTSLGTVAGIIVIPDGVAGQVLAGHDIPAPIASLVTELPWAESPAVRAVAQVGRVIKGSLDRMPLTPAARRHLADARIGTMVMVGLHRDQALVGVLAIGWAEADPVLPSDAAILLVASHVARSLENARLVEEIVRRAEAERAIAARLRALEELTRVGGHVTTLQELADRSAQLINTALGGAGTAYGLLGPDGQSWAVSSIVAVPPAIAEWLRAARPDVRSALRRWKAGEGAFMESFEPGVVPMDMLELARGSGLTAYAAIPIRVDDTIVGGIAAYFDRPADELYLDRGALDRIATFASIAVENFQLRERILASEARYRTLFAKGPDALLVATPDGTIIDANDAAARLYGADREWLLGRTPGELAEDDLERIRASLGASRTAPSITRRAVGVRRDGTSFPGELEVAAIDVDGQPRLLLRIRDLTEQDRLQRELIQAQKMEATGQLVSGVAHELNNPLAAILGFSQLIRRDPSLPEDLRHNADLLVEEASRTRRIVQNLLDFARQRPPERHPTAIKALVDSVLILQSYSLGPGLVEVEIDIPEDLPAVELDRGQLQQVLVNLTHNAVYAIRHGGGSRLRISALAEGPADAQRVRITVADDGPGVAIEHVGRLFDAFFTTKPPSDGTGLGLPVSFGIVAAHGGELRYTPSPLGRGAAFTFDLPVHGVLGEGLAAHARAAAESEPLAATTSTAESEPPAESVSPAARPRSRAMPPVPATPGGDSVEWPRIVVIDDETSIRIFLGKALRATGYEPILFETGQAAVAAHDDGPIAAILCDHQMAGMSGVDVYHAIVTRRPELARSFVLMSGDILNAELEAFTATHAVGVLSKPFDLETLARVIGEAVAAGQSRR